MCWVLGGGSLEHASSNPFHNLTRFTLFFFIKHSSNAAGKCETCLTNVRGHGEVETVRSDDGASLPGRYANACELTTG